MSTNIPLSGARLWDSLMEMARIGATPKGGCNRQTLTDLDGEGRHLLRSWAKGCGLAMAVDRVGNMVFRREGRDPARKPVAIGSHLDTQPTGGKFDGPLGVLAGLEVMRALHEAGIETEAPLLLINWTNEEGARFSPPMMGSGAAMGLFAEKEVLDKTDGAGAVFGEELRRIGWRGTADPAALQDLGAYFELHIEQGPALEREGAEIGVVTHALAQSWYEVTVEGEEAHGGSAMQYRRDALMAAGGIVISAVSATLIQLWFRTQARRKHFRRRQTSSRVATFAEAFSSIAWAATAGLAAAGFCSAVAILTGAALPTSSPTSASLFCAPALEESSLSALS